MRLRITGWLLLAAAAGSLPAQTLTPRQLFYSDEADPKPAPKAAAKPAAKKTAPKAAKSEEPKPAPAPAAEAPAAAVEPARASNAAYVSTERPLGLRYSVVQVANGGTESEVSPTAMFHAGDMVRVKVEGNRDGYLYVILRGSSGNWKPLFPAADINGGENRIAPHRGYRLPSDTQAFTFDEQAGQEQLFVIYSPESVKDIDALIPSLGGAGNAPADKLKPGPMIMASAAPIDDEFVSRLRNSYSRDLVVQTVEPNQPADAQMPENAVYVVSKTGGRVVADIQLEHR